MNRIAIVEDLERMAELVREALLASHIAVDTFATLAQACEAAQQMDFAVWIIDRGLPDGDGLELVRRLRADGKTTPCLMLTARDALHDRVAGLDSGADDYLTKPFSMEELVARVRALMRRPATLLERTARHADLRLELDSGRLHCATESVSLAPTELQIVISLLRAAGQPVRRATLELAAWGLGEAVTPNALDVALHRIRRKLLAIGSRQSIENIRNYGFALREHPSS
ncbi:response regulator transcription factor [Roseateles amylovorans]|uniref:Response regulator transcription factor n=1 Tax=Roseateles amylovorans TaxID=2978473 RepID=A0ABY6B124_9BURK|nr:response regulator transcription factor [Roseateles amylovorans]UXH78384.1 response regulator transcription factor [Roseateles amylovorans]